MFEVLVFAPKLMHQHIVVSILDPGAVRMMRGVKADKCHNSERSRALQDNIGLVGKCWAPDCGQWLQISHVMSCCI